MKLCFSAICSLLLGLCATATFAGDRTDALVTVLSRLPGQSEAGSGFVIGDGSLVVTARHVLFCRDNQTLSESCGLVTIVSPYLGDVAEGRLILADPDLDLAVVETPWKGHPALKIASDAEVRSAKTFEAATYSGILRTLVQNDRAAATQPVKPTIAQHAVKYVGIAGDLPVMVSVRAQGELLSGWSGSPMLLPGTDRAAAVFTSMRGPRLDQLNQGEASVLQRLVKLLKNAGFADRLNSDPPMPRPKDAEQVLSLIIQDRIETATEHPRESLQKTQELIKFRPANPMFTSYLAADYAELHQTREADEFFRKSIKMDAKAIQARTLYAQFLAAEKQYDEALKLLEQLRKDYKNQSIWAIGMCNIYLAQKKPSESIRILHDALAISPNDMMLWALLGEAQRDAGDHAAAVESLQKAVILDDQTPSIRFLLADELTATNQLDSAEAQYRELVKRTPGDSLAHFGLAHFLSLHRPGEIQEALAEAQMALGLPEHPGRPPKTLLQNFVRQVAAQASAQPTTHPAAPAPNSKPTSMPGGHDFHM